MVTEWNEGSTERFSLTKGDVGMDNVVSGFVVDDRAPVGQPVMTPSPSMLGTWSVDMVNEPPHYTRGPQVECPECGHVRTLEHIEVFRWIKDSRMATAFKYVWRVGFGGKEDDVDKDREDVQKARFYLQDFWDHPA